MKTSFSRLLFVMLMLVQAVIAQAPVPKIEVNKEKAAKSETAVRELIQRIVPRQADKFVLETIVPDTITGKVMDVIEIESQDGKIVLRGNSATSLASAFNYYLENYGNVSVAWDGFDQLNLANAAARCAPEGSLRQLLFHARGLSANDARLHDRLLGLDSVGTRN